MIGLVLALRFLCGKKEYRTWQNAISYGGLIFFIQVIFSIISAVLNNAILNFFLLIVGLIIVYGILFVKLKVQPFEYIINIALLAGVIDYIPKVIITLLILGRL